MDQFLKNRPADALVDLLPGKCGNSVAFIMKFQDSQELLALISLRSILRYKYMNRSVNLISYI